MRAWGAAGTRDICAFEFYLPLTRWVLGDHPPSRPRVRHTPMSCHLNESGPAGGCGCSEMRVYSSYSITLNRSSVISPNDPLGGTAYSFKGTFPPFQHRLARSGGQTTHPPSQLRLAHSRCTGAPAAPCSLGTCSYAPACVLSWPDAGMRRSLSATSWWGRGPPPKAGQSPGPCPASLGSEPADRATRRAGGGQVRHD